MIRRAVPWLRQIGRRSTAQGGAAPESRSTGTLLLASYNVHKCVGTDGLFDPLRIKEVILSLNADVVALQEADARFGQREGLLDLGYLQDKGGYRSIFDPDASSPSHGWHGNVVLYRNSVLHHVHRLTLPGLEPRGALVVDFGFGRDSFRLIAAHLGLLRRSRTQQVNAIIAAATAHSGRHVVIVGDMNEWRLERRSALNLFKQHFHEASACLPSFPSRYPVLPLDRVFLSDGLKAGGISVVDTPLTRLASDHLPIIAEVGVNSHADGS